jgi:hypothetical protein
MCILVVGSAPGPAVASDTKAANVHKRMMWFDARADMERVQFEWGGERPPTCGNI